MKITEIEIGKRYGAHDFPTRRPARLNESDLPREVEAVAIETVEKAVSGYGWSNAGRKRSVRMVRVRVIGVPTRTGRYGYMIAKATDGQELVVEARKLLAPWEELAPDVLRTIDGARSREEMTRALEERLDALLPDSDGRSYASVESRPYDEERPLLPSLRISGADVERILSLAEAGARSSRAVNAA